MELTIVIHNYTSGSHLEVFKTHDQGIAWALSNMLNDIEVGQRGPDTIQTLLIEHIREGASDAAFDLWREMRSETFDFYEITKVRGGPAMSEVVAQAGEQSLALWASRTYDLDEGEVHVPDFVMGAFRLGGYEKAQDVFGAYLETDS